MKDKHSPDSGFTLLEIVIVMLISSLVMIAAYNMYISIADSNISQSQAVDTQQNIRDTMNYMARIVRSAGIYKPSYGEPCFSVATSTSMSFMSDTDGDRNVSTGEEDAFRLTGTNLEQFFFDQAPQWETLTDNIEVLDFVYIDTNDAPTTIPGEIQSVDITIISRAMRDDPDYTNTISYTNRQGTVLLAANDNFRRRILTRRVKCRNMAF